MTQHARFEIVVGFDFSDLGWLAFAQALQMTTHRPASVIHVVGILPPSSVSAHAGHEQAQKLQHEIAQKVDIAAQRANPAGLELLVHARIGSPADEILSLARDVDADLIIVGTHGRTGVKRWVMGSVAERVVREAACPVFVVRSKLDCASALRSHDTCPECAALRTRADRTQWWCNAHGEASLVPRMYSYRDEAPSPPERWSSYGD
jgi:nucleotide-binding universal stress UspA family protein